MVALRRSEGMCGRGLSVSFAYMYILV
ncbi:hypothetical protein CPT_Premi_055 [Proteus phage Premi]|uniref:Uncharacterized protein n=1 Tax=Proteus phage Premi TaxID=3097470 RepID=A0ABZ0ZXP9_9CAUD|nr:hypothetical protein CPT_Premi_055 [Proteus phage Premi]